MQITDPRLANGAMSQDSLRCLKARGLIVGPANTAIEFFLGDIGFSGAFIGLSGVFNATCSIFCICIDDDIVADTVGIQEKSECGSQAVLFDCRWNVVFCPDCRRRIFVCMAHLVLHAHQQPPYSSARTTHVYRRARPFENTRIIQDFWLLFPK